MQLLGVRYNDIKNGTNVVEGVLDKYWEALQEKKMIASDGLFADFLLVKQHVVKPPLGVGWTAWYVLQTMGFDEIVLTCIFPGRVHS